MQTLCQKFNYNLTNLLGNSEYNSIAVAVSGGSDSVALLVLMSKWAKVNDKELHVMSVDHNLRLESKFETAYVQELSQKLGHSCAILNWDHQNNFANLSARAREGRYQLMTDLCHQLNIVTLLTAHHQDDYIENFYIRRERKSGILGLSSSNINFYNNIRILRPLFNIKKSELIEYLTASNVKWFEDESNYSDKYLRNRIRKTIEHYRHGHAAGAVHHDVNIKARQLKEQLIKAIAETVAIYKYGFAKIDLVKLCECSEDIKLQLLGFVLTMISGNNKLPRARSTEPILLLLSQGQVFTKTLHGCIIRRIDDKLLIYREFGIKPPKGVNLSTDIIWDNRFRFDGKLKIEDAYVTYLSMADYIEIKKFLDLKELSNLSLNNHRNILFTLPVIKILEKTVAIPHISFYNGTNLENKMDFTYQPSFTSRFTHFC